METNLISKSMKYFNFLKVLSKINSDLGVIGEVGKEVKGEKSIQLSS